MTDAVICDVDGTLVDVSGLREWVTGKRKDYHKFHSLSADAPPIEHTIKLIQQEWDRGAEILIVTAREELWREMTMAWLTKHNVPYHRLLMRPNKDYRPDYEIKKMILDQVRDEGYNILWAYDDNPAIIKLWDEEAIPVTVIAGWED